MLKARFRVWLQSNKDILNGFKAIEVEKEDGTVLYLQMYRAGFSSLYMLEDETLKVFDLFHGRHKDQNAEAEAAYNELQEYIRYWRMVAVPEIRMAKTVHMAHDEETGATTATTPLGTWYVGTYPVYPRPIGHHRKPVWRDKEWPEEETGNPLIRQLVESRANVFPRYARKEYAGRLPGQFIGLGGRDARLFRDDPEAVEYIRKHYSYRIAYPSATAE